MVLEQSKSLRQLQEELTGIRVSAADTSLWSMSATVSERARVAINDAIKTFPFYVRHLENTITLPYGVTNISVPPNVDRVVGVSMWDSSMVAMVNLTDVKHIPTPQTNMIRVNVTKSVVNTSRWVTLEYEARVQELPLNDALGANLLPVSGSIYPANPSLVAATWPSRGYFELTRTDGSLVGVREVVYYKGTNHSMGFVDVDRGVMGTKQLYWPISASVTISPVLASPPNMLAAIMAEAEANMYAFWVSHRSMYDQFVTLAGQSSLDVTEILTMVRTLELRADRRASKITRAPAVTRASVRRKG